MSVHSQTHADSLAGSVAAQKSSLRSTYHTTATAWPSRSGEKVCFTGWVGSGDTRHGLGEWVPPERSHLDNPSVLENGGFRRPTAGKRGMGERKGQAPRAPTHLRTLPASLRDVALVFTCDYFLNLFHNGHKHFSVPVSFGLPYPILGRSCLVGSNAGATFSSV